MLLVDFQIASRNLLRHTRRNLFLGGALAVTTALLVLLNGLADGMKASLLESATTLMTGHVNVGGFYKVTSSTAAPLVTDYQKVLAETRKHVPELDYYTVRVRGYAKAVSEKSSMDLVLGGVDVTNEPGLRRVLQRVDGRLDDLQEPGTLMLFEDQAKRLEVRVGDMVTLVAPTTRGQSNTADLRVVFIAKGVGLMSAFSSFLPAETLRKLYNLREGNTGAIQLYLRDHRKAPEVAARLRTQLAAAGWRVLDSNPQPYWMKLFQTIPSEDWTGQKLDMSTWEDEMSFLSWIFSAVRVLSAILIFVLMAIVIVGILNTLAIAIRERTREIGTLRAIGMQRRKVRWLLLLEAGLLGVLSSGAGAAAALALATGLNRAQIAVPESVQMFLMQQHLFLATAPAAAVGYAALLAAVTTLASLLPATWAARLQPITAMHHIG
jgi:ABC-type lipoprotein release transport system permease subunit